MRGAAILVALALTAAGCAARSRPGLNRPVALAAAGESIYVLDGHGPRRLDVRTGHLTAVPMTEPLSRPEDLAPGPFGGLLVSDGDRVLWVDPRTGVARVVIDGVGLASVAGSNGTVASHEVTADARGNVFVAHQGVIVRIDPQGKATRVAGVRRTPGQPRPPDLEGGQATAAPLNLVNDILAGPDGSLLVAESGTFTGEERIRRVDPRTGVLQSLVGPWTAVAGPDGAARPAVVGASGLAWDADGGLVFTDRYRRVIRRDADGGLRVLFEAPRTPTRWGAVAILADGAVVLADTEGNALARLDPGRRQLTAIGKARVPRDTLPRIATAGYPEPANRSCTKEMTEAVLIVTVRSARGPIPAAVVRSTTPGGTGFPAAMVTDEAGEARVRAIESGDYAIFVSVDGFLPAAAGLHLSTGCTARLDVLLREGRRD